MSSSNPSTNNQAAGIANAGEKKVETVDYRTSAGGQQQEQRPVQVTHQPHPPAKKSNTSGGVLENAAASAKATLQTAREAISN
ncbi:hypothetical protein AgCh_015510 [Apium graveolens]